MKQIIYILLLISFWIIGLFIFSFIGLFGKDKYKWWEDKSNEIP